MLLSLEGSATGSLELQRQLLLRELAQVENEINQVEHERAMLEDKIASLKREQRQAA